MSVTDSAPDLSWLADSPLFIDSQQIGAFYDAVVGPASRTVELQIAASRTEQRGKSAGGHLTTELSALFPWLKIDTGMQAQRTAARGRQASQNIILRPIDNAARQLVQLRCTTWLTSQTVSAWWAGTPRFRPPKPSPRARG